MSRPSPSPIRLQDCLWVHGVQAVNPLFQPLVKEVERRGIRSLNFPSTKDQDGVAKLLQTLRQTDAHVILHYLQAKELRLLYPLFKARRNFSMLLVDWWTSPFWFTQNAEYACYNLYSGIAVRLHGARFCNDYQPPFFSKPEVVSPYSLACSALRPAAALGRPLLDWQKQRERANDHLDPKRLIYFPISFVADRLPVGNAQPRYDVCSAGDTGGFWMIRDPYASARYNFTNLYADRRRLTNSIQQFEDRPFKIFDRRRSGWLTWEAYCQAVHESRLAIVTGGVHEACVPKFLEFACLGAPMIGSLLPYEYPWLDQCLFPIDALNLTPEQVKQKVEEALALQPRLRQNCLALRDTLIRRYSAPVIFDLAQAQIDGQPIPSDYVRLPQKNSAPPAATRT